MNNRYSNLKANCKEILKRWKEQARGQDHKKKKNYRSHFQSQSKNRSKNRKNNRKNGSMSEDDPNIKILSWLFILIVLYFSNWLNYSGHSPIVTQVWLCKIYCEITIYLRLKQKIDKIITNHSYFNLFIIIYKYNARRISQDHLLHHQTIPTSWTKTAPQHLLPLRSWRQQPLRKHG